MVALAAVSRSLAGHRMLAMTLAAILCHGDSVSAFLEAGKARPGQKRDESQKRDACYPEVMFFGSLHGTIEHF